MQVDAATGKVTWSPQQADLGTHAVALRVDDGRGGTAEQDYTITAITAPPNRPPVFTSTPVVDANVNTAYTYQATAVDPDGDPLKFALLPSDPVPVPINDPSFEGVQLRPGDLFTSFVVPGWTGNTRVLRPGGSAFPLGAVPDGQNVLTLNANAVSQVLSATL